MDVLAEQPMMSQRSGRQDTADSEAAAPAESKTWTNMAGVKQPKAIRQSYRPLDYRCDHRAELSALSDRQRLESPRGSSRTTSRPVSRSEQQNAAGSLASSRPATREDYAGRLPSDRLPRLERADLSITEPVPPLLRADFAVPH